MKLKKILIVVALVALVASFFVFDLGQYLNLAYLKQSEGNLRGVYDASPVGFIAAFLGIYIASTALSLPGAAILTLAAGAIFGLFTGVVVVSFASSIGASLAFLMSRYVMKDWVQSKFGERLAGINRGVEKEGAFYLFTLRLVPVFPFFLVNLLMGLTPMRLGTYYVVSQIGMLLGTIAYVNAGTQLARIESLKGLLSPGLIGSFVVIGLLPLVSNKIVGAIKSRKVYRRFKRPAKADYNLVVIGAGSAGLVSSYIAAAVKARVALIEKNKMGGDCLNTGCVPSKALIRSAKVAHYAKRAKEFGMARADIEVDFAAVMERIQGVIKKIEPHDSIERYSGLGVECITGSARVKSPFEVEVNGRTLTTRNIIIATGAGPFVPPIPGLNDVPWNNTDNLWGLRELPKRFLVVGGGPIGAEIAQSFQRLGSKVTIVEAFPRILGKEDPDVSAFMQKRFEHEGVRVCVNHKLERFEKNGDGGTAVCSRDGEPVRIEFDRALIAIGRRAHAKGFGLEEIGVQINDNGTVQTDEFLATNFPNIFVAGDVVGHYQFTHTAAHQAWFASVNALFGGLKKFPVDYRVIPWATYTDPEVAQVGLNETELMKRKIPFEITRYGIDDLDRAIAESEDEGWVKVFTPPGKDTILGATIVGHNAGELIAEFILAMKWGIGLNKILSTIHPYPTMAEANKYAAGVWKKAHAPEGLLNWVRRYHAWKRG